MENGVSEDCILDDVRDSFESLGVGRQHHVKKQDIANIKKKLNLQCAQKHPNDLSSVCAWVEELRCHPYNPVVIFKPQGETCSQTSSSALGENTFCWVYKLNTSVMQCDIMEAK